MSSHCAGRNVLLRVFCSNTASGIFGLVVANTLAGAGTEAQPGLVRLRNVQTGKCLTIRDATSSASEQVEIIQRSCQRSGSGTNSQKFYLIQAARSSATSDASFLIKAAVRRDDYSKDEDVRRCLLTERLPDADRDHAIEQVSCRQDASRSADLYHSLVAVGNTEEYQIRPKQGGCWQPHPKPNFQLIALDGVEIISRRDCDAAGVTGNQLWRWIIETTT